VDAREGGETLGSVHSRPGLELAAAASNGAGGGLTAARPGQEGSAPSYGRPGSPSATTGPFAASMGARAGLGRSEWQGGKERTGGPLGVPGRTARGARRGWTSRWPWDVRGFGERASGRREGARTSRRRTARAGALWRAGARATSSWPEIVSDWPCSSEIYSKNLNTSARSDEYESCRSSYPLQLL
jgi:hypothetical protein